MLRKFSISFLFLVFFFFNFLRSLYLPFDHDENLYVSGAWLISQGFLPYQDFPYPHPPLQPLLMFLLVKFLSLKLFVFRFVNVIFSLATLIIVFFWLYKHSIKKLGSLSSLFLSLGVSVLIFFNPIFIYSSGKAWNHDISVFFLVLSLYFLSQRKFFFSGVAIGMCLSARLTFLFFPFFLFLFIYLSEKRRFIYFFLGLILGLLPIFLFLIKCSESFLLQTLWRARLLKLYYQDVGLFSAVCSLKSKIHLTFIWLKHPSIVIWFLLFLLMLLLKPILKHQWNREEKIFLFSFPAIILSVYLPPPLWRQYFYPFFVFVALFFGFLALSFLNTFKNSHLKKRILCYALILAFSLSFFYQLPIYIDYLSLFLNSTVGIPYRIHYLGRSLEESLDGQGKVLTLCPLYPIEGELRIYPELGDGPFRWRLAFTAKKRGIPFHFSIKDFLKKLENDPPKAILLGCESSILEEYFFKWAKTHGYAAQSLGNLRLYLIRTKNQNFREPAKLIFQSKILDNSRGKHPVIEFKAPAFSSFQSK